MARMRLKQYVVKKHVMALDASDAIKREQNFKVDDVWLDEEWVKNNPYPNSNVGFKTNGKKG